MKYVFFGGPDLAARALASLVERFGAPVCIVTTPPRKVGRGHEESPSAVGAWARESLPCVPLLEGASFGPEQLSSVSSWQPDLLVVVAYPRLLGPKTLAAAKLGAVNFHPSLLPAHRGPDPVRGPLLAGEEMTGISVMLLDEGFDTGPVLIKKAIPILPSDDYGSLYEKICAQGMSFFAQAIADYAEGKITLNAQSVDGVSHTKKLLSADEALDPAVLTAENARRLIRALSPVPGAYVTHEGKRVKLLGAPSLIDPSLFPVILANAGIHGPAPFAPGLHFENGMLLLACADGNALLIPQVKPEGGKAMPAKDWANGLKK